MDKSTSFSIHAFVSRKKGNPSNILNVSKDYKKNQCCVLNVLLMLSMMRCDPCGITDADAAAADDDNYTDDKLLMLMLITGGNISVLCTHVEHEGV